MQIIFIQHFFQPTGDGFQIASGQSAVGGKSLDQNQAIGDFFRQRIVVHADKSADIHQSILFRAHRATVAERKNFLRNFFYGMIAKFRLAFLYQKTVFRKAAGIKKQRDVVFVEQLAHCPDVGQRYRLPAAGIVGDGHHHQWNFINAVHFDHFFQLFQIHIAFERVELLRVVCHVDHQIHRHTTVVFHICAGSIEMDVVGNDHPFFQNGGKQQVFRNTTLMGGDNMFEAKNIVDGLFKMIIIFAPGVGFIAEHHTGPLVIAHRRSAAIGQQINVNGICGNSEYVESRCADQLFAFFAGGAPDGFNNFNAEGFGRKLHHQTS